MPPASDRPQPDPFENPAAVASYVERTRRAVPGLDVLHRIVDQLLAESVPDDGRVLVVGAGGGIELAHLAERHGGWTFDGVDPSAPMLQLARETMGATLAERAALHQGDVTGAPDGPFDGATCLLTLHFLTAAQRLETLREIARRLRPGAPLLVFHHSVPGDDAARAARFDRYARFAAGPDAPAAGGGAAMAARLPPVGPDEDERLLRQAGFDGVELVYAALTLSGWLARAAGPTPDV